MDKSSANEAATDAINAGLAVPILVRQAKYLSNIVEQAHRAIKRLTKPMLNFKSFRFAGFESMHTIRKGGSQSTAPRPCRSPTDFQCWQEWSVWNEQDSVSTDKFLCWINNATEPELIGRDEPQLLLAS